MSFRLKDPNSTVDYSIDWSDWLEANESITSDTWTITPSGTLSESSSSTISPVSTIFVTGGTRGETYRVTCRIISDNSRPRTVDRTITIRVGDR